MSLNEARDQRRSRRAAIEVRQRRRWRWRMRPTVMTLEDRRLLSTFQVQSTADPATLTPGTLRWAVEQANAATSPSAIEFELGPGAATITLLQGQLELSNASDATTILGRNTARGTPVLVSGTSA